MKTRTPKTLAQIKSIALNRNLWKASHTEDFMGTTRTMAEWAKILSSINGCSVATNKARLQRYGYPVAHCFAKVHQLHKFGLTKQNTNNFEQQ